ncbi:MAG: CDGSH iron-sulfur domain-containing protein [Balneolaceae bacterium]|nr:CDGSH iron-sulfur domain-containing protein [Balneolaceae bacterium]
MEEKKRSYESESINVTYDLKRCIHAAECVRGLREVFNPDQRPWIQPEKGEAEEIAEVVTRCPTGALKYERKDGGEREQVPPKNTISISKDGPVYVRGDLQVKDAEGNIILEDTRLALCRCGISSNKPLCDNSHVDDDFMAPSWFDGEKLAKGSDSEDTGGKLVLKVMKDGPVLVEGPYQFHSETAPPTSSTKKTALCRCGGSANKPFCDGTHKEIGFEAE